MWISNKLLKSNALFSLSTNSSNCFQNTTSYSMRLIWGLYDGNSKLTKEKTISFKTSIWHCWTDLLKVQYLYLRLVDSVCGLTLEIHNRSALVLTLVAFNILLSTPSVKPGWSQQSMFNSILLPLLFVLVFCLGMWRWLWYSTKLWRF